MNVAKQILLNYLLLVPGVRWFAKKFHTTGLNADREASERRFDFYKRHVEIQDKSILEIGPGQTLDVLLMAKKSGARKVIGIDISRYYTESEILDRGLKFEQYDGRHIPLDSDSLDVIWASDVFEHVKYPNVLISECHRVLRPGGEMIAIVDLRDHFYIKDMSRWFSCMRYSKKLWNSMTWNRSNYVNRLRLSEWQNIFKENNFHFQHTELRQECDLLELNQNENWSRGLSEEDIITYRFSVVLKKL